MIPLYQIWLLYLYFVLQGMGLVAEAGPEAIIPLSVGMRSRALALYEETGRRLGVRPYAEGGFAGSVSISAPIAAASVGGSGVVANITAGPVSVSFNISTSDGQDVLQAIRANYKTIANEVAEVIAVKIEGVFKNMTK